MVKLGHTGYYRVLSGVQLTCQKMGQEPTEGVQPVQFLHTVFGSPFSQS